MRRVLMMILTVICALGLLVSCAGGGRFGGSEEAQRSQAAWLYEAEDAQMQGLTVYTRTENDGLAVMSGEGYVGLWDAPECSLTFSVEVPASGTYALDFLTASSYDGESYNTVGVNDRTFFEALWTQSGAFGFGSLKAELAKGANTVTVTTGWGWFYIDCLVVRASKGIDPLVYDVPASLTNEHASDNARRLMRYLADQYGNHTLSGQYASDLGVHSPEVQAIYGLTAKYPAIVGFDLMDYSPSRVEYGAQTRQTDYALEWGRLGGIVSLVWHWNAPKDLVDSEELPWWKGFYTEATTFNLDAALNGDDPQGYDMILRDLDAIAAQLERLAREDIPVLWRPLHEASGGWFWWGAHGADNFKKLWRLMYERFSQTHHLNNLIWVFNGQDAAWYPGDDCVDIIAEDVYTQPRDYESQYNKFERALGYTDTRKIVGLSENGVIPDPDLMKKDNARWSFFITWCELYVVDPRTQGISDEYNELDYLTKVYHSSSVITLDELPSWENYPLD